MIYKLHDEGAEAPEEAAPEAEEAKEEALAEEPAA